MSRINYNKLIRDKIPEIIQRDGRSCEVEVMPEVDYEIALREKLVEEAQEAVKADGQSLVIELADIEEIILALLEYHQIKPGELDAIRAQRHRDRGGFAKRLKLLWTE